MTSKTLHYNYLFIGKKYCDLTLLNEKVFPLIMNAITPLLDHTDIKKCRILPNQYVNNKEIKLGGLPWNKEKLSEICSNYKQYQNNGSFNFGFLSAEFPSIEVAYKNNKTADIYLYFENDLFWGKVKSDGDCGLFISLREDIFQAAGETKVMQVIKNIHEIFDNAYVLFSKRSWWSDTENEESALQDVAAWRAIDKLYAKYYESWIKLDL